MNMTIGIGDSIDQTSIVLNLVTALRIPNSQANLVYVIENLGKADALVGVKAVMDNITGSPFLDLQKKFAKDALSFAAHTAKTNEIPNTTHMLSGLIANRLIKFTQDQQSDLLALGSSEKLPLEAIMIGSVGRKAVISASSSVLIAKRDVDKYRRLKAVLATDHSAYANQCFNALIRLAPQGFESIVVTTVYPPKLVRTLMDSSPQFKQGASEIIEKELNLANHGLIEKLSPLNSICSSRVEEGIVTEVLNRVMNDEQADILILGAQGHGFLERISIGSVSLKMAMTQPKSILLLRSKD